MLGCSILPSDCRELQEEFGRWIVSSIHHRLVGWRCLQYPRCSPARRPTNDGMTPFSEQNQNNKQNFSLTSHEQIILAIYYTIADIVLLAQCFYYRGFTWKDEVKSPVQSIAVGEPSERTGLLPPGATGLEQRRRSSTWSEASHLSPVVPLHDAPKSTPTTTTQKPYTRLQTTIFNSFAILMVCAAGILGWYVSNRSQSGSRRHHSHHHKVIHQSKSENDEISLDLWGQIFGYFCAVLYLGSRIPQILLNYRRKSTEGVSMLFFLFACIGNLTYVLSIFAYDPHCHGKRGRCEPGEAGQIYARYILMNASWIAGSLGTLFLDMGIFAQFFLYREREEWEAVSEERERRESERDQRPLLEREDSEYV